MYIPWNDHLFKIWGVRSAASGMRWPSSFFAFERHTSNIFGDTESLVHEDVGPDFTPGSMTIKP